jgi:arabinogalactan endo-1,4-beta-galactosidase
MIAAFKPNGDILKGLNGNQISKIEVSGTLKLDTNGQSVDLMELIKNDPTAWTRLTEGIIEKGFQNKYGRSPHAPQRYTFG